MKLGVAKSPHLLLILLPRGLFLRQETDRERLTWLPPPFIRSCSPSPFLYALSLLPHTRPCINDKQLDRAPLRFAPRSTVLPAWLAPLAAKRSVASLPHNETGHTWSHLVTTGHKLLPGHRWSHGSYPSHQISQWERDISPDGHTDGNTHYTVLKGRRLLYR